MKVNNIVVHSSGFHANEIVATALYIIFLNDGNLPIIHRTRDLSTFDEADTVFIDVGMKFDNGRYFDHHQFRQGDDNWGTASAGLVWNKILSKMMRGKIPQLSTDKTKEITELVEAIDARDTKVNWDKENVHEPLLQAISDCNNIDIGGDKQDRVFIEVMNLFCTYFIGDISYKDLYRLIQAKADKNLDAKDVEEEKRYHALENTDVIMGINVWRHPKDLHIHTHRFFKDIPFILISYDTVQNNYTVTCNTDFCTIEEIQNEVFIHVNKFMAKTTDKHPTFRIAKTIKDTKGLEVYSMIINQDVEDDAFKACPICRDDGNLMDVNTVETIPVICDECTQGIPHQNCQMGVKELVR